MNTQHTTTVGASMTFTVGAAQTEIHGAMNFWGDPHIDFTGRLTSRTSPRIPRS